MPKAPVFTILKKELLETFRDRRSLTSSLLVPLLGAGLLFFVIHKQAEKSSETKEVDLHVKGAEHAPALVQALERRHITIKPAPSDPIAAIRDQSITAFLEIPASYDEDLARGTPVEMTLKADMSNGVSAQTVSRAKSIISGYGGYIGQMRAVARGVPQHLLTAYRVERVDLATDEQRSSGLTQLLLMFALMSTAVGAMHVATDSTAGERERKSLEPLLSTPASRRSMIAGKWLAASIMAALTSVFTVFVLRQTLLMSPYESLGMNISLAVPQMLGVILCLLPLAMLMSATQLLIGIFARSYREAQTYLGLFMIFPILPTYIYDKDTGAPDLWMHAVPSLGQHIQCLAILRGEAVSPLQGCLSAGTCLVLVPVLLLVLARLLRSEKIIYGR